MSGRGTCLPGPNPDRSPLTMVREARAYFRVDYFPGTWVNKGKKKGRSLEKPRPSLPLPHLGGGMRASEKSHLRQRERTLSEGG